MGHLIGTIRNCSIPEAVSELSAAHAFIAARAHAAVSNISASSVAWGGRAKRLEVQLTDVSRPSLVQKDSEKFTEAINILATAERLLAALRWFADQPDFRSLRVKVCHPSTSSLKGENDLVLANELGTVRVRCEVCDVVATSAGQNGKERKELANLECTKGVPKDSVRRFVCTSQEFANALTSARRVWASASHRYVRRETGDGTNTVMLELQASSIALARRRAFGTVEQS